MPVSKKVWFAIVIVLVFTGTNIFWSGNVVEDYSRVDDIPTRFLRTWESAYGLGTNNASKEENTTALPGDVPETKSSLQTNTEEKPRINNTRYQRRNVSAVSGEDINHSRTNFDGNDNEKRRNNSHPLLSCTEIKHLEIIRRIGEGKQKITYEVKLPWGEHALAKRCTHRKCWRKNKLDGKSKLERESAFLRQLQDQYGDEGIGFFGECNSPVRKSVHPREVASNFSVGYTSVVELGKPLVTSWNDFRTWDERECIAKHFTDADIEGFRTIARQYANYSNSPRIMCMHYADCINSTDNGFAEQYLLTKAGMRHGDLDMLIECPGCSYEEALDINCRILSQVTYRKLNCSLAASLEHPVRFPDDHINVTEAFKKCRK